MNSPEVNSTISTETLALVDLTEASFWLSKLFSEIYGAKGSQPVTLQSTLYTDSKQLHEKLFLLCPVLDQMIKI